MYLPRFLEETTKELSQHFKVILLVGARQVGKTTLLKNLFPKTSIVTFDPIQDIENARKDPDGFLERMPTPLILDEVQFVPELLSSIKRKVDTSNQAGQYFLTGSQNLMLLRSIAESMAGRVAILRLEHLSLLEKNKKTAPYASWLQAYLEDPRSLLVRESTTTSQSIYQAIFQGCFPVTATLPETYYNNFFESYLRTFIERDARAAAQLRNHEEFGRFMQTCAALTAQEVNNAHLGREIGISNHSARDWLHLLEMGYQWRSLPPFGSRTLKKITGKKKGYLTDTGLACQLLGIRDAISIATHSTRGALFETWVVNLIHQLITQLKAKPHVYHWRLQSGAEVDIILEINNTLYPIEIKMSEKVSRHELRGIYSFRSMFNGRNIAPALVIYGGSKIFEIGDDIIMLPWNTVLS